MNEYIKTRFLHLGGYVSEREIKDYEDYAPFELERLFTDEDPKKRSIAAAVISRRRLREFIPMLCQGLVEEEAPYSRRAIAEALGQMGEAAVKPLVDLLGKIGHSQETALPQKMEKRASRNSYPVIQDVAANILVKIGNPAIPALIEKVKAGDGFATQQAIDAIGGIVSKTGDKRALPALLEAPEQFEDEVSVWKIVRALSAFQTLEVIKPLELVLQNHPNPIIRREAARSIGHIGLPTPNLIQVLKEALKDKDKQVRKEVKFTLKLLKRLTKGNPMFH